VALGLAGVDWREVRRGDVLCAPGAELSPTFLVDAALALEPGARPLRRGARLHVHHGTREAPARVIPLESDDLRPGEPRLAQLRLEAPLVPAAGDRFVLRQLAPPDTIGGGTVLDPRPRKHGARAEVIDRLRALARGEQPPPDPAPPPAGDDASRGAGQPPLDAAALRLAELLRADGVTPRADRDLAEAAGLAPAEAAAPLRALERAGQAVRVGRSLHFHAEPLQELVAQVLAICERDGGATIAGVRDELGTSRRYAQALLEHLDARRQTVRRGDVHVLRGRRGRV
jgi:selenocysteine-specific elongation factor